MVFERHIVWYSEYIKFFSVLTVFIYFYTSYVILQHVSAVRGHRQVLYESFTYTLYVSIWFTSEPTRHVL
jgi:hypothetical protein